MDRFLLPLRVRKIKDGGVELLEFTASTDTVDRAGDKIDQNFELRSFRKNPVFLWGHRYAELPIGRIMKIWKTKEAGKAMTKIAVLFVPKEIFPFADQVKQMYEHDPPFLAACSIGFRPLERAEHTPEERQEMGMGPWSDHFTKSELLEVSAVTVPMNGEALQESVKRGFPFATGEPTPEQVRKGVDREKLIAWHLEQRDRAINANKKAGKIVNLAEEIDTDTPGTFPVQAADIEVAEFDDTHLLHAGAGVNTAKQLQIGGVFWTKAEENAAKRLLKELGLPEEASAGGLNACLLMAIGSMARQLRELRRDILADAEVDTEEETDTEADEAEGDENDNDPDNNNDDESEEDTESDEASAEDSEVEFDEDEVVELEDEDD